MLSLSKKVLDMIQELKRNPTRFRGRQRAAGSIATQRADFSDTCKRPDSTHRTEP
jgi:hypothetical protein